MPSSHAPTDLRRLLELVARLRAPDGCPWDREQTIGDLRAYLLEEAHEAAAAIDSRDWKLITEELGDLLFQIAFVLRLGEEGGVVTAGEAVDRIEAKMIERHPHVFADASADDADAVRQAWEQRKAKERTQEEGGSHLSGVQTSMPALLAAYRMTQKASGVGFDWKDGRKVRAKLDEELGELDEELDRSPRERDRIEDEVGDVLFTVANLSRHLGHDPEAALARANLKFRRRFERVEALLAAKGARLDSTETDELERLWQQVKEEERAASAS